MRLADVDDERCDSPSVGFESAAYCRDAPCALGTVGTVGVGTGDGGGAGCEGSVTGGCTFVPGTLTVGGLTGAVGGLTGTVGGFTGTVGGLTVGAEGFVRSSVPDHFDFHAARACWSRRSRP